MTVSQHPRTATITARAERAASVARLRADGLTYPEIARRLGISRSFASELAVDPDGDRVRLRKARAGGTCTDCSRPTTYKTGGPATRCDDCAKLAQRYWTADRIIGAMHAWRRVFGEQPDAADWHPWMRPTAERHARWRSGHYPPTKTVQDVFGSWNDGIRAAGFAPFALGQRRGERLWNQDDILAALRAWIDERGQPSSTEWKTRGEGRPTTATVAKFFGTWNQAIILVGGTPRSSGAERTFDYDEARRLRAEGLTFRAIGERLGRPVSTVQSALWRSR